MGDVHWYSFDGLRTDFQGHCSYQLAALCDPSEHNQWTPFFNLNVRQSKRADFNHRPYVTYVHGWTMLWKPPSQNYIVKIHFDRDLNNGLDPVYGTYSPFVQTIDDGGNELTPKVMLKSPYWHEDYEIKTGGHFANVIWFGIDTEAKSLDQNSHFQIKVWWDRNYKLFIDLEQSYKNKVCGILGNFNDDQSDEWLVLENKSISALGHITGDLRMYDDLENNICMTMFLN